MKKYIYGYISVKESNIRSYDAAQAHKIWKTFKTHYTGKVFVCFKLFPHKNFYVNKKECCMSLQVALGQTC